MQAAAIGSFLALYDPTETVRKVSKGSGESLAERTAIVSVGRVAVVDLQLGRRPRQDHNRPLAFSFPMTLNRETFSGLKA